MLLSTKKATKRTTAADGREIKNYYLCWCLAPTSGIAPRPDRGGRHLVNVFFLPFVFLLLPVCWRAYIYIYAYIYILYIVCCRSKAPWEFKEPFKASLACRGRRPFESEGSKVTIIYKPSKFSKSPATEKCYFVSLLEDRRHSKCQFLHLVVGFRKTFPCAEHEFLDFCIFL